MRQSHPTKGLKKRSVHEIHEHPLSTWGQALKTFWLRLVINNSLQRGLYNII